MRKIVVLALFSLLSTTVYAQRGGGGRGGGFSGGHMGGGSRGGGFSSGHIGGSSGFVGGGAYRGGSFGHAGVSIGAGVRTGHPGGYYGGSAYRGGYYHGGYSGYHGYRSHGYYPYYRYGFGWPWYGGFYLGWPLGYASYYDPYYYGSYYGSYYAPSYGYDASTVYYADNPYSYSSAPSTPVVVNQYYSSGVGGYGTYPQPRPNTGLPAAPAAPVTKSSYYLIAFPNGNVVMAVAYWLRGDSLHYITKDKQEHQVPLSAVDQEMTTTLNRERGIDIQFR